jgi:HTH-type transcriptional regulator/antitoxin HigA
VIKTRAEYERIVDELEMLTRKADPTAEDDTLAELLGKLIQDYSESEYPVPEVSPNKVLQFLLDQRGLKQADLVPAIGARSQVSDMVTGRRGISKSQAKKLAKYFHVSPEVFI